MEALPSSSVFYGLVGMFGWGVTNFLIASASKRHGAFRTAFLTRILPFFITLLLLPIFKIGKITWINFLMLCLPGFLGSVSYLSFTKGLSIGSVSIVTPIVSSWAIVTATLSFLFLNESLTLLKILGILTTLTGIFLVSTDFKKILREKQVKLLAGAKWAGLTALGWGLAFFLLALFSRKIGWYPANLGIRFWSAIGFLIIAFLRKKEINQLLAKIPKIIYLIAVADVIFFIAFNLGLLRGEPAVVSALAGASPLISVLLAAHFLKEKTVFSQKVGILLCLAGIVSLSLV